MWCSWWIKNDARIQVPWCLCVWISSKTIPIQDVEPLINISHQQRGLIVRDILPQGDNSPTLYIKIFYSPSKVCDANNGLGNIFFW